MAVKKQKRAAKSIGEGQAVEKPTEPSTSPFQICENEPPAPLLQLTTPEPPAPAPQGGEASLLSSLLEELVRVKAQNDRILTVLSPMTERLDDIGQRIELLEKLQGSSQTAVGQEAMLSNLKSDLSALFDVRRSGEYLELSSKTERLVGELEDLQLQLKGQYEKYAALRLEMEEERESAARLLQAARQREKALEQNVYQLNIREEELEELAVLNEELDAKMLSQSEEFAKRTQLFEEEIFALKTAEADHQSKIAELEAKLQAG